MLRIVGAVVLGYLVMFVLVFTLFSFAYFSLGVERTFKPNSYEPSDTWIWISFALGLLAAIIGGIICARVGKNWTAVLALAVVVILLGLLSALPALSGAQGEPQARTGDVSNTDAMMKARTPGWVALLNPVIGAAGVILGGRMRLAKAAKDKLRG